MSGAEATSDDWREVLRVECARHTQVRVAKALGYSPATVSQVLKGSYRGDMAAIESAVKGALMGGTVFCPAFHDEIPQQRCQSYQRRPFSYTNAAFNRIWRACRNGCPHSRLTREDAEVGDVVD